jgi:hypothetical protein
MTDEKTDILDAARRHFDLEVARREEAGDETMVVHRIAMPWNVDRLGPGLTDGRQLLAVEAAAISLGRRRYLTEQGAPIPWIETPGELRARFFECLVDADGRPWSALKGALNAAWDVAAVSPGPSGDAATSREYLDTLDEAVDRASNSPDPWLDQALRVGAAKVAEATEAEWSKAFESGRILVFRQEGGTCSLRPPQSWTCRPPIKCPGFADLQRRHASLRARWLEARLRAQKQRSLFGRSVALESIALSLCPGTPLSIGVGADREPSDPRGFAFLLSGEVPGWFHPSDNPCRSSADEQIGGGHVASRPPDAHHPLKRGRPGYSVTDGPLVIDIVDRVTRGEFATVSEAVEHAFVFERDRFTGFATEENLKARVRKKVGQELRGRTKMDRLFGPNISN